MRIDLPGGWADLLEISALNADHQDEYVDLGQEIREKKEAALAATEPAPLPDNPAVMADPADKPAIRLTRKDVRPIQDLVAGWVVKDISYPGVLPWNSASRALMPLPDWNVLRDALEPYFGALNGESGPKEATGDGSAAT